MVVILATLLAAQAVPGCISIGPALHCDLAPATVPLPAALVVQKVAADVPVAVKHASHRHKPHRSRTPTSPPTGEAPSGDEIARHIESLVSIGDCTGTRTYALSVGAKPLAEAAFARCAGLPPIAQTAAQP